MKKARRTGEPDSAQSAYARALRWLTARELSEAQVRSRLAEAGYSKTAIAGALQQLLETRTLDDRRAATAVARTEARVRRHGPRRVMARLMSMDIDRELARDVITELFGEEDEAQLLETTLDRRLRGKTERLKDPNERKKLIAYLVRQGFSVSASTSAVRKKSSST